MRTVVTQKYNYIVKQRSTTFGIDPTVLEKSIQLAAYEPKCNGDLGDWV